MSKSIIKINNLSKCYRIGAKETGYKTFREAIIDGIGAPFRNFKRLQRLTKFNNNGDDVRSNDIIWALKDISFNVDEGEVVGIIGKNGAGKSTLLKILSRITEPTSGIIEINGRVSSLLEVGTGFHPELTGRENIFLNGAVLGMRKGEIEKKFDEIVNFAEIEKFLDTPVKRYSSGMYVRLAFAVAAYLEPEVLLVDEVLSVGDVAFQKKCLGKMEDVAKGGRTVLFVSHNMGTIDYLCERAILLNNGRILMDNSTARVIREYTTSGKDYSAGQRVWSNIKQAPGDDFVRVHSVRSLNQEGEVCALFDVRDPVILEIGYWILKEVQICTHFELLDDVGRLILTTKDNLDSPWRDTFTQKGFYRARCYIPGDFLNNGNISINYAIITGHHGIHTRGFGTLVITVDDRLDPQGVRGNVQYEWGRALVRPRFRWNVEQISLREKDIFS